MLSNVFQTSNEFSGDSELVLDSDCDVYLKYKCRCTLGGDSVINGKENMAGQRPRHVYMIDRGCPSFYRMLQFLGRNEASSAQMDLKLLSVFILLLVTVARLLVKKTNKYHHLYLNRLNRGE